LVLLCGSLQEKSPGPEKSSGIILEDLEPQFHLCPNASQTFWTCPEKVEGLLID
jgi:hypothetical protein